MAKAGSLTHSNTAFSQFASLSVGPANEIYVSGFTFNTNNANWGTVLLKLSPEGDLLPASSSIVKSDAIRAAPWNALANSTALYVFRPNVLEKISPDPASWWVVNPDEIKALAFAADGALIAAGRLRGTTQLGDIHLDASQNGDAYVGKLNSSGKWIWVQLIRGTDILANNTANSAAVDADGNICVTGEFAGKNYTSIFIAKLDSNGELLWQNEYVAGYIASGSSICTASDKSIYATGYFSGETNRFDEVSVTGAGLEDFFLAKLNPAGQLLWIQPQSTKVNDLGRQVLSGESGLYVSGWFAGPLLPLGSLLLSRPTNLLAGISSAFIAKRAYNAPPSIFGYAPTNYVRNVNTDLIFDSAPFIDASLPMRFSWSRDGMPLPEQTNSTLSIPWVKTADAGEYRLQIINNEGTNNDLVLNLGVPPVILVQPASQSVSAGADALFSVSADGAESYSWRFNGTPLPGQTESALHLSNVRAGDAGTYSVVASNRWGIVSSAAARLTVILSPAIVVQPESQSVLAGANVVMSIVANGAMAYQWRFNGMDLPGQTAATLVLNNVSPSRAGTYQAVASNAAGSTASTPVILTVNVPPRILEQPQSVAAKPGQSATFAVNAENAAAFQWYRNGQSISGATNQTLTIRAVTLADRGEYTVRVAGQGASVLSDAAQLIVNPPAHVQVSTIAGNGTAGLLDSTNGLQARLNAPDGPSVAPDGTIYFAETLNNVIRFLTPKGAVGTLAGTGRVGYLNGPGAEALFSFPNGTCVLRGGDLLVTDAENDVLRRIVPLGANTVSTFAGDGARGFINGSVASARFAFPNDLAEGGDGTIYISEFENNVVRSISRGGTVAVLAGNGTAGYADGRGAAARLNHPGGITLAPDGNLYLTEFSGNRIRKITPAGVVTTVAGTGAAGFRDGIDAEAEFSGPNGIVADANGNLYVTESGNHSVRMIRADGSAGTVAGAGVAGFADGDEVVARFNAPGGIALARDGSLIIADTGNNRIRRIDLAPDAPPPSGASLLVQLVPSVTIFGLKGQSFRIESADRIGLTNWSPLTNITLSGPVEQWIDPRPAAAPGRIYRAVLITP